MSIAVIFIYPILICRYLTAWKRLPEWFIPQNWQPETTVSVIIPARNEMEYVEACLASVFQQNYPSHLFEIIVIDDHSDDGTKMIIESFIEKSSKPGSPEIFLLPSKDLDGVGKKAALTSGISKANGTLIVTTDADCIVPENWLNSLVSYFEDNNAAFIAAPVNFHRENNLLEKFQSLDYMGMMLITGAGIHGKFGWMSNGANLAYPRIVFEALNGFSGVDHIASGDDMLFMQKVAERYPDQIGFVKSKNATVLSIAKPNWHCFLQQRIRWAGKTGAYRQPQLVFTQSLVFIYCALIFLWPPLLFLRGWTGLWILAGLIAVKYLADYFLLKTASSFFDRKELMKIFPKAEWLHTAYIFLTGLSSMIKKKHVWKDRKVK